PRLRQREERARRARRLLRRRVQFFRERLDEILAWRIIAALGVENASGGEPCDRRHDEQQRNADHSGHARMVPPRSAADYADPAGSCVVPFGGWSGSQMRTVVGACPVEVTSTKPPKYPTASS